MNKISLHTRAALAAVMLAAPCAQAQELSISKRQSQLSGNYLVGYATVGISGTFSQTWVSPETSFEFATADSDSIDEPYNTEIQVTGLGSYDISQSYSVSAPRIEIGGQSHNTLASHSPVSGGARGTSTLWLDFNLSSASSFSFSGNLDATPGAAVDGVAAVATSTLILERAAGGNERWAFNTPGAFGIGGQLPAGDWRLYGNAHTRLNGDAIFTGTLVLSPVPEPAGWSLAMAGLLPLSVVLRRRRRAVATLAAAGALAAGPALAVPGDVNTLGQPEYYTTYRLLTPQGYGAFDIKSQDDAINGSVYVVAGTGTMWDRSVANQQAVVVNNGVTYYAGAMGPTLQQAPELTTVTGAITTVDIFQSFQKASADAQLSFTYTGGKLQLFKDPELGPPCIQGCAFAEVVWQVSVTPNDTPGVPIMVESGRAAMGVLNSTYRFYSSQTASDGSPANPLWQWDCTGCERAARNVATATLQAPFTGIVDLSGVPFDAQNPVDFTVSFSLQTTAYVTQEFAGAKAWARDPLGAVDDGVALSVQGLVPTNMPVGVVPEPQTWALMLAGAAWIAWRRRAAPR